MTRPKFQSLDRVRPKTPTAHLSQARIKKYANLHIPLRVRSLEACMCAVRLIRLGATERHVVLTIPGFLENQPGGGKIFCEAAIDAGLISLRVVLNFLGIYLKGRRTLQSREPNDRFQKFGEVW